MDKHDPLWVDVAYWTILRRGQMESLRMIDEDEWPDLTNLPDYHAVYEPDPNFYTPHDYIYELGAFLRDHTVRQRKQRVQQKHERENENRNRNLVI